MQYISLYINNGILYQSRKMTQRLYLRLNDETEYYVPCTAVNRIANKIVYNKPHKIPKYIFICILYISIKK